MEPVRTCLGCRQRAARSSLVRVVAHSGEAVVDARATLPGRGAWVHPNPRCVSTAIERRAFRRALRVEGQLGTERLATQFGAPPGAPQEKQAD
ncbi:MAG TPA: YlxR family protein [Terrimesophilobacter sp.]|nr:YlxR family protein [Terrimesophilobacter sp.]HRQ00764.1 YlxR family protein [Terrimesophilobacter sp.]